MNTGKNFYFLFFQIQATLTFLLATLRINRLFGYSIKKVT